MSATRGQADRIGGKLDVYPTPYWCVHRLLEAWVPLAGELAEPCVGEGHLLAAARAFLGESDHSWRTWEIRDVVPLLGVNHTHGDFLLEDRVFPNVGGVITNPPFTKAEAFIRHCRKVFPNAELCMLLRIGFICSEERVQFRAEFGAPDLFFLPNRPSFRESINKRTGKKTRSDSAEYAWFVYPAQPQPVGEVRVLATTPLEIRKRRMV